MSRTKLVLGIGLVLGLAAISSLIALERRAADGRAAQVSIANISAQLTQLELIPLTATAMPGSPVQKTLVLNGLFRTREQAILSTLARLRRGSAPNELGRADPPLRAALAAAEAGIPVWIPAKGMDATMIRLLNRQGTTLVVALQALDRANHAYGARASTAQNEALIGSAIVVALLLGAFGFFYRRSEASRHELHVQGATLRLALSELEAAQIERAQLLKRTVEIAEHERSRVAADLHDGPIQRLSAVTLGFDLLANQLKRGNTERASSLVETIRDSLAEETVSLRRLMSDLRPPILDERDLGAALNDCAQQVFEGSNVRWQVKANGSPIRLAPEVETVAYRVVREALVNVRKHAPDANVIVGLEPAGNLLRLSIVDDGPGFDEESPVGYTNGRHYGLIGMRERVDSVGGTWSLTTAPTSGTRIELALPGTAKVAA